MDSIYEQQFTNPTTDSQLNLGQEFDLTELL